MDDWMDGRMDDGMDVWKASRKMTTTSFTICNNNQFWCIIGVFFRVCGTGGHLSVPLSGWSIPLVKRVMGREHCMDMDHPLGTL
jgi:hypothetical protein